MNVYGKVAVIAAPTHDYFRTCAQQSLGNPTKYHGLILLGIIKKPIIFNRNNYLNTFQYFLRNQRLCTFHNTAGHVDAYEIWYDMKNMEGCRQREWVTVIRNHCRAWFLQWIYHENISFKMSAPKH